MATSYGDDISPDYGFTNSFSSEVDKSVIEKLKALNAQTPAVAIVKKAEQSGLVHDDLKEGMHVRLKCGCEGFIHGIGNSDIRDERWFAVLNTKAGCRAIHGVISLESIYAELPGKLRIDTYHSDAFSRVLPAFECPAPSWFKSMKDVPRSANERRAVRVRLEDGVDFLIPGALMNTSVYQVATILRSLFKGHGPDVEVIENLDGIASDSMGKAPELFKKVSALKSQTIEEKNAASFYNWVLCRLYASEGGETIMEAGNSMLSRDTIKTVFASIAKHPMWRSSKIEVTSKEGYVVILKVDGSVQ